MADLRIEYTSRDSGTPQRHAIPVPYVQLALTVAQINHLTGAVELWDGDRQLARLVCQGEGLSPLWQVG